jgi:GTP-binding protein Era
MADTALRSGFVALIGRPNVGKSTLLNALLGEKLAIVSPKPQTTRHRILGILHRPDAQVMFLDSPGFHEPQHALGRQMMEAAKSVLEEADVIVVLIDAQRGITAEDLRVFVQVKRALEQPALSGGKRTALLVINKVDLVKKPRLLPVIEAGVTQHGFTECIPISALTGVQLEPLLARIIAYLPEGPQWYEPHQHTDQTAAQRAGELIREQVLLATREEVPHAVAVRIDQIEEGPKLTSIQATIVVDRPGQKAIVIGKGGLMLKSIGMKARAQLEPLLGRKVFLGLWVKVIPGWRSNERLLRELGYTSAEGAR